MLESWEAFDLAGKIALLVGNAAARPLELAPHKYTRGTTATLTIVGVEKWVKPSRNGYAIKVTRKGATGYNVSVPEAQIQYAAALLRHLAITQSW